MKPRLINEFVKGDVEKYVERRKREDVLFAKGFEAGYKEFKAGVTHAGRSRRGRNAQPERAR